MDEKINEAAIRDEKYRIMANTVTISKFGPSGSLRKAKKALEHTTAVMAKIVNEVFFELKFMVVIIR